MKQVEEVVEDFVGLINIRLHRSQSGLESKGYEIPRSVNGESLMKINASLSNYDIDLASLRVNLSDCGLYPTFDDSFFGRNQLD